jgi:vacuolar-type H+-ATPase subunit E/Vma4
MATEEAKVLRVKDKDEAHRIESERAYKADSLIGRRLGAFIDQCMLLYRQRKECLALCCLIP